MLSIIPVSPLVRLTVAGAKWELSEAEIEFGSTRPLRNVFADKEVVVQVTGTAVVVHRHSSD
jgi:thiamine pyrophosphokinase